MQQGRQQHEPTEATQGQGSAAPGAVGISHTTVREHVKTTLTIDCMGGDHGPSVTVPAAVSFVRSHPDAHLMLVGLEAPIRAQLKKAKALDLPALSIVPASEVVAMDDSVEVALRRKKDSSMRVALTLVKEESAQACISAGNTGALMAVSRYVLKTLAGIERPAIASALPNPNGYTMMLDLGANVDCEPQHLLQFAEMGHALVSALEGKERPTIGLLNIGEEVIKGNETIKRAGELLRASTLNFRGNVEGNDIYKGTTDVIVCDGFVGNVALKTSEGLAQMLSEIIREEFGRSPLTKLMALFALPVLMRFKKRVDHRQYNGAALLGLRGLVIKSHGSADAYAFEWAIKRGYDAVKNGVLERLAKAMEENAYPLDEAARAAGGTAGPASPAGRPAEPFAAVSSKA
jgi:phosphate acyltransferase